MIPFEQISVFVVIGKPLLAAMVFALMIKFIKSL